MSADPALLYNLLLSERYEFAGFNTITAPVERYRELLADWQLDRARLADRLATWDRHKFWQIVLSKNPRVAASSRRFVDDWLDLVDSSSEAIAEGADSRDFIVRRELAHKRSQARLRNEKLLASWQGASGAGALVFRWPEVRGILVDIHLGLERADA